MTKRTQFENYLRSEANWKLLGVDEPRVTRESFRIIESQGEPQQIDFCASEAISMAMWTGSTGSTVTIQNTSGVIEASATVSRI